MDEEREYTINPDGSGKVKLVATFSTDPMITINGEKDGPENLAKDAVKSILQDSRGVATWADVSYEVLPGKKVKFEGTAYFPDLNKVELKLGSMAEMDALKPAIEIKGGLASITCPPVAEPKDKSTDLDAQMRLPRKEPPEWNRLSREEQELRLMEVKAELARARMMFAAIAAEMRHRIIVKLPAAPQGTTIFKRQGESSVMLEESGEQLLAAVDQLLADDEPLRELLAAGHDIIQDGPPAEMIQGVKGDPEVSFAAAAAPQFDYAKEQEAAAAAFPQMMEKLGLVVQMAPPIKEGAKLENVRLAGVRMVTKVPDMDLRPFNWSPGMTLAFIAELPGSVFSAGEGKLTSFVMEGGEDMFPESDWSPKPQNVEVSGDGKWLKFEVETDKLPSRTAKLKELAGEIECLSAGGSEWLDLGFASLKEGAKAKHHNSEIRKLGKHSYKEGRYEVSIHFELQRDLIKEVKFYNADGVELLARPSGGFWDDRSTTLRFSLEELLPLDGRVKAEFYTDVVRVPLSFKLEDVGLIPVK